MITMHYAPSSFHIGHCQLNYWTKNERYCLQDQGERFGGIRVMRCSQDYEPSYPVTVDKTMHFELPTINESLDSDYTIELKSFAKLGLRVISDKEYRIKSP